MGGGGGLNAKPQSLNPKGGGGGLQKCSNSRNSKDLCVTVDGRTNFYMTDTERRACLFRYARSCRISLNPRSEF